MAGSTARPRPRSAVHEQGPGAAGQAGEYADENSARAAEHVHYVRIAFTEFLTVMCVGRCSADVGVHENDGEGNGASRVSRHSAVQVCDDPRGRQRHM
jgi:hypothetical protein